MTRPALFATLFLVTVSAAAVPATAVPNRLVMPPETIRVVDAGDLLTPAPSAALSDLIEDVYNRTGVEVIVVTAGSLGGMSATQYSHAAWDVYGGPRRALLLITKFEGLVTAQFGPSVGARLDPHMTAILSAMIPGVRDEQYNVAVLAGVRAVHRAWNLGEDVPLSDGAGASGHSIATRIINTLAGVLVVICMMIILSSR